MSGDDWKTVGEIAAFLILGGYTAIKSRSGEKNAKAAKEYAKPTGNGFAQSVKDSLSRIEAAQIRSEAKIDDHIRSHADADVKRGKAA